MPDFHLERILVPTDLSEQSIVALQYARLFAERFGASLTLFYADPILFAVDPIGTEPPIVITTRPEHLEKLRDEIRVYASKTLVGIPYEVAAVAGQPIREMIVREAEDVAADLIVMATHGLRGWRRAILGSVTEGVLHAGAAPVLSVSRLGDQPRKTTTITKILCPINFTDVALDALDYAAHLAARFGCELLVVHVIEKTEAREADIRKWIPPSIRERCTFREIIARGGPAERVLDCAEDLGADLLVIGAQHKAFRDETTIGATTERLVRFARLPVLSVPRSVTASSVRENADWLAFRR
jgi:nucleotide-binding universal stress UspA family protein